jgi:YVTN family beta-propeller protein
LASNKENGGLLLVANKLAHTMSIVDPVEGVELSVTPVGGVTAHEVAGSPNGRFAWLPIYGDSGVGLPGSDGRTINIIDIDSREIVSSIDLGQPSRPHCVVFGPKDGRAYVTSELTNSIEVIDPATNRVVDSLPTGQPESHMMVISSDGKRAYTSNVGAGTVSAIDIEEKKTIAVIHVSRVAQRISISNDDRWIFTADQIKPELVVIDAETNSVSNRVPLSGFGFGTTPTLDGNYLLIAQPSSETVSVFDLSAMKIDKIIQVPAEPQEILVRPDNAVAYVSCDESKQVAVIDLSSWKVEKLIDVGKGADGLGWAARY